MKCGKPRFLCREIDSYRGAAATACPQPDDLLCHQACVGGVLRQDTPFLIFLLIGPASSDLPVGGRVSFSKLRGKHLGMSDELKIIVELQHSIDELKAAEDLLAGIPDWMRELHEQHTRQKAEMEGLQAAREEAELAKRAADSEISDLQAKVKHFQEQIGMVRNQREYGALLQEIDTAKEQISSAEERELAAMEQGDEAKRLLEERSSAFQELNERYQQELQKWEGQKPDVARRADELRQQVAELEAKVPKATLALFERTRLRHGGSALALVMEVDRKGPRIWHCGACNYRVRPQTVVSIQAKSIVTCDSCRRILHIEEDAG
jgi:predicted  nucleic acid-binding Zn-ribbon protein